MPERLIRFAPVYRALRERQCGLRQLGNCASSHLLRRPYSAIRFMTTMLHEKVGTSDRRIPGWHRHAIDMALNRELSDDSFSRAALTRDFSKKVWQQFEHAATQESGKKISERFETQTYGAVKELLDRLREAGEPNVFK
jgi:hypothetical protein